MAEIPTLNDAGLPFDRRICPLCFGRIDIVKDCYLCEGTGEVCGQCRNGRVLSHHKAEKATYFCCPNCTEAILNIRGYAERNETGWPQCRVLSQRWSDDSFSTEKDDPWYTR